MTNNNISRTRVAPPIGGFIEIDGRRIFVHRAGSGGPAVVFLSGASAVGLDYFAVQQGVSEFSTAVVYDRCGTGFSDHLPLPRTAAAVATELRELLRACDIPGPYVLAAHSLGGLYAHRFAQLFPSEVAGLIWLDALHREWDDFMPAAVGLAATERMAADPDQLEQLRPILREWADESLADYPKQLREQLFDAKMTEEWIRSGIAEQSTLVELAAELRIGLGIPDVPVIALTVLGGDPERMPTLRAVYEAKTRMDAALVNSVEHGEQRILTDTLHHRLCVDRPDAVVAAVRDIIARVSRS
ncbi:alpha/beta fold hydrolase [Nocardia sp. NPDC059240]|uniref:alpha/beta fold hydrolase n=1 Tax=Nocardia sp. NPDC059240 TaxID=3346786 RepID=UPI0036B732E7